MDKCGLVHTCVECLDSATAALCAWCDVSQTCVTVDEAAADCPVYRDAATTCFGRPEVHVNETGLRILAGFGLIASLVVCFYGYRSLRATFFTLGFAAGSLFAGFGMYTLLHGAHMWAVYLVALLVGLGLGYLFVKLYPVAAFLIGGFCGAALGLNLYLLTYGTSDKAWLSYVVLLLGGGSMGAATVQWDRPMLILATSVLGAFGAARLLDFLSGNHVQVNVGDFQTGVKVAGDDAATDQLLYTYLILFVLLALAGLVVQFKYTAGARYNWRNRDEFDPSLVEAAPLVRPGDTRAADVNLFTGRRDLMDDGL